MENCNQYVTYGYEDMFFCERERGHDGPHRHTEDTPARTLTVEWTPKSKDTAMKHTTRPKLVAPEGTYVDPETGAFVMPEGCDPLADEPYYTQETHDGPVKDCPICNG